MWPLHQPASIEVADEVADRKAGGAVTRAAFHEQTGVTLHLDAGRLSFAFATPSGHSA